MDDHQREALKAEIPQDQIDAFGASNAVQRHLEQCGLADGPDRYAERFGREALLCERELGRDPSIEEFAGRRGRSVEEVEPIWPDLTRAAASR